MNFDDKEWDEEEIRIVCDVVTGITTIRGLILKHERTYMYIKNRLDLMVKYNILSLEKIPKVRKNIYNSGIVTKEFLNKAKEHNNAINEEIDKILEILNEGV